MSLNKNQNKTRRIALLGIFTAIILIQNFVPFLGNIPIPPLNPTIIHITVIVAALTLGTKDGMIIGAVWGITRMVRAYTMPASPLDIQIWTHPMIALVPRILIGTFTGGCYLLMQKILPGKDKFGMMVASIIGSLTNTIFVLMFIYIFRPNAGAQMFDVDMTNLLVVLSGVIATSGIGEAIAAAIISPLITVAVKKSKAN